MLVTCLLENGKIETTVTRAKEVRAMAEKYITLAKDNTLTSKRQAMAFITKEDVIKKLYEDIAPAYASRNGGYTRITRIGPAAATQPKCASSSCFNRLGQMAFNRTEESLPSVDRAALYRCRRLNRILVAETPFALTIRPRYDKIQKIYGEMSECLMC